MCSAWLSLWLKANRISPVFVVCPPYRARQLVEMHVGCEVKPLATSTIIPRAAGDSGHRAQCWHVYTSNLVLSNA
jgi:hypothetical protein